MSYTIGVFLILPIIIYYIINLFRLFGKMPDLLSSGKCPKCDYISKTNLGMIYHKEYCGI